MDIMLEYFREKIEEVVVATMTCKIEDAMT